MKTKWWIIKEFTVIIFPVHLPNADQKVPLDLTGKSRTFPLTSYFPLASIRGKVKPSLIL